MFPEFREMLMYVLGFLVILMSVLVILIMRKRVPLGSLFGWLKKKDGDKEKPAEKETVPEPPPSETGPADDDSIKNTLNGKAVAKTMPKPPEAPIPEPPEAHIPEPPAPPEPPAKAVQAPQEMKPVFRGDAAGQEAVPEEHPPEDFMVLDDHEKSGDKKPEPKPMKEKELVAKGLVKPKKDGGIIARFIPRRGPSKIQALEPKNDVKEPGTPPAVMDKATPVDSAAISKDLSSLLGHVVSIEGDLQLSSKGTDDFWYVLFDKGGSSVVRSGEKIMAKHCRLVVKVEKTKLGQVYLNVIRQENLL